MRKPCLNQPQQQQQQQGGALGEQPPSERNGEQTQTDSPQSSPQTAGAHGHDDENAEPSTAEEHAYRNRKDDYMMLGGCGGDVLREGRFFSLFLFLLTNFLEGSYMAVTLCLYTWKF